VFDFDVLQGLYDENEDGPYYTQLGAAASIDGVRQLMEARLVCNICSMVG